MLRQILTALSLTSALVLAPACGDDTGGDGSDDDDDDGAGNSGNSGTGNSGNEGTGNTGNEGTGNTGNEGTGNAGTGGAGNTGNGGSGNEGTGNTGNTGGGVSSCEDLCDLAPVDSSTAACVTEYMALQGYDVGNPICEAANTSQGCLLCYDAILVSDADCVAVHPLCF